MSLSKEIEEMESHIKYLEGRNAYLERTLDQLENGPMPYSFLQEPASTPLQLSRDLQSTGRLTVMEHNRNIQIRGEWFKDAHFGIEHFMDKDVIIKKDDVPEVVHYLMGPMIRHIQEYYSDER